MKFDKLYESIVNEGKPVSKGSILGGLGNFIKGKPKFPVKKDIPAGPKKLSTYDDNVVKSRVGQKMDDIRARSRRTPKDLPTDVKAPGTDAGDLYHGLRTTPGGATVRSPLHPTVSRTGKQRKWDIAGNPKPSSDNKYGVGQKFISPELGQGSDKQKALKTVRDIFKKDRSYQGIHKMRTGPSASASRSLPLPQTDYKAAQIQQRISTPKIKDLLKESAKGASLGSSLKKTIKWLTGDESIVNEEKAVSRAGIFKGLGNLIKGKPKVSVKQDIPFPPKETLGTAPKLNYPNKVTKVDHSAKHYYGQGQGVQAARIANAMRSVRGKQSIDIDGKKFTGKDHHDAYDFSKMGPNKASRRQREIANLLKESAKGASLGSSLKKTIKWLTGGKVDVGSMAQKRLDKISPPTTTKVIKRSGSPVDQILNVPGKPSGLTPRKR